MKTKEESYRHFPDHAEALAYCIIDDIGFEKINLNIEYPETIEQVGCLLRMHQEAHVGNWQNWDFEKKAKQMLAMMRKIVKKNDWDDSYANLINRYS